MLFNSPLYIFVFLPIVVLFYFFLNKQRLIKAGKAWLVLSSMFFYGYWKSDYLFIIVASMLINYSVGMALQRNKRNRSQPNSSHLKATLVLGIVFNLGLLGYFKYTDFFITNINLAFSSDLGLLHLMLPLAISFFTFQQIAYLVDCFKEDKQEYDFLNYCLFVTFFPQLIAGPIVHHKEMMPQFSSLRSQIINYSNIAMGLLIFSIGLFKKVAIADNFAIWASAGFDSTAPLTLFEAWGASLSYTLQLYYDFSGYSDMAIGAALMFNIRLPVNFNSPYKAVSIQDFWRRWHITLSTWLRDYLYIPLGGNRKGPNRSMVNLFITMLLGGLWHGAGWTFVLWGALHGAALAVHRAWRVLQIELPAFIAWAITFLFINFTWVFFRAESYERAIDIIKGMLGFNGVVISQKVAKLAAKFGIENSEAYYQADYNFVGSQSTLFAILIIGILSFTAKNTQQVVQGGHRFSLWQALFVTISLTYALLSSITNQPSEFLYFNF